MGGSGGAAAARGRNRRGRRGWLSSLFVSIALACATWPAGAEPERSAASDGQVGAVDPSVNALVDFVRGLQGAGKTEPNFTPLPGHGFAGAAAAHAGIVLGNGHGSGAGHGASPHGASPHGASPHGAASASGGPRFDTRYAGHGLTSAALPLPPIDGASQFEQTLRLAGTLRLASITERRILRSHETRRTLAARLAREPDYVAQMPELIRDAAMVTTWVALENFDDAVEPPKQFGFIEILAAKADSSRPVLMVAKREPKAEAAGRAPMVAPAPGDPDGRYFVGSKPCETCHAGLFDEFQQTVMGRNIKSGKITPQGKMECETCHGPGSAHVNGGGGREKGGIRSFRPTDSRGFDVAEANSVCLSCHEKGDQTYWQGSQHESRGLACVNCHTVMRKVSPRNQLKTAQVMDTCFQCHKDRKAQVQRTSHMPIRETKITCVNCHNPHGSATEKLLKEATVNDTCYTCHADKRGPFLFEHPPVRENCLNCHEPHGSNHESLLIVARQRLCQQCHTNPHNQPGLPTAARWAVGNACQNCHNNIHGSNSPSGSRWHR
ncbi:DmsE family decaheme c-type cytochrome [Rhodopseudomonas palustris]|uniref:DmsE family decaheme c-type cytochrome n=2 Tax=Rhodopseudomonas TaxID=1073 RepID=UPI00115E3F15|nr:DmsE family decaheme c-type cytochrome [Rhodopseudomonas palustris]QDM00024.1 DmsE family decaheme c-type cytochrome [Rhodopseudomonas palustris]